MQEQFEQVLRFLREQREKERQRNDGAGLGRVMNTIEPYGNCFEPDPQYGAPSLVVLGRPPTPVRAER